MSDVMTMADISLLKAAARRADIPGPYVMYMSREAYIDLRVESDPFGIYRQRRLMSKVLPEVMVYRGDEWWQA